MVLPPDCCGFFYEITYRIIRGWDALLCGPSLEAADFLNGKKCSRTLQQFRFTLYNSMASSQLPFHDTVPLGVKLFRIWLWVRRGIWQNICKIWKRQFPQRQWHRGSRFQLQHLHSYRYSYMCTGIIETQLSSLFHRLWRYYQIKRPHAVDVCFYVQ
jgi:hypothetical protein